jgi:hypothetical protein
MLWSAIHLLEEISKLLVAYASAIESDQRTTPKFCNFSETARSAERQFLLKSSRALPVGCS